MSDKTTSPNGLPRIETDQWYIDWDQQGKTVDLTCKDGSKKHTRLCGDPHIFTDGAPPMDFPSPTCTFVLTDASLVIVDAPAPDQALNDLHVFTTDAKHYPLGQSQPFDDVFGTLFLQREDGSFYGIVSRDMNAPPRNIVPKAYQDVT